MTILFRAARPLAFLLPVLLSSQPILAEEPVFVSPPVQVAQFPPPTTLQTDDPWLYRGGDIPHDEGWLFGELPNGLRYAVRNNRVPGQQVSIRVRIDAGSLNEQDSERGYAHLIEHLTFRESKYLANGQAIPTWQRLGARLGADTNASTTPTQTVYQLDLPNANSAKLDETMKLLSGMIREPTLSEANIAAERPIVLAERRESSGPSRRVSDAVSELFYKDQLLAQRSPGGTTEALEGATSKSLRDFHSRWYRPENTVIAIVGDGPPEDFAALIERYYSDWAGQGKHVPAPDFGSPKAPGGADPSNPVGDTAVLFEPAMPRSLALAILRPWGKPIDNLEYNRGLMIGRVAEMIINRRLEERARAGGSYVIADVGREEVSRSVNATFVNITPLGTDWKSALTDVRAVIADALGEAPSEEEIARELAEIDVSFANVYEQRINQPGPRLADELVGAVDIREAVASPETFLTVFRDMRDRFTPEAVLEQTRALFTGTVTRGFLLTPVLGEATPEDLRAAMLEPVEADRTSRLTAQDVSFDRLPPIGTASPPVSREQVGLLDIQQADFANGVKALFWRTDNEPGRVTVKVRFGSGLRGFSQADAPYIELGQTALVASGLGPLGASELDAIATGRKLGFNFTIDDGVFAFQAETRKEDLADQLYLFAGKLDQPRWDERPVERAKVMAALAYGSLNANPASVLNRDLEWLVNNRDARFGTATPAELEATSAAGFRSVWEPLLKQGPVEVLVFGDIDPEATVDALSRTFGALDARDPIPAEALARQITFPEAQSAPLVLHHDGEADQGAAVVAWPLGGGSEDVTVSRELELLAELFSNRLLEAMREGAGVSYTPFVTSSWPMDVETGGRMLALGQLNPEAVPQFFEVADQIATELATTGPTEDEIARVTEPFRQTLNRVVNGHGFWMSLAEGATTDPARLDRIGSLMSDYTETTPARMRQLAAEFLPKEKAWRLAVLPKDQQLPETSEGSSAAGVGR